MRNRKKSNIFIAVTLMLSLVLSSFAVAWAKPTEEDKRKEAKAAGKKAAQATENLKDAQKKLEGLKVDIENKKIEIDETKVKIKKKKKEMDKQNDNLDARLTAMYKTGTVGYVDVILGSQDITDLISNIGMVQQILENDQDLLKKMEKDHKKLKALQSDLEEQEVALEANKAETEELKKKFKAEADKWKKKEEELQAEADALAAEAARSAAGVDQAILAGGGSIDTSNYAWPAVTTAISDGWGWRICPFHGREFHNGLDITAGGGTPVYAINDGVINSANWNGGYGNCIILQCGGGITALYGHLSGFNCSTGQVVKKGQVIGYVGTTGNSTGYHLHFTVFKYDKASQSNVAINPYSLY